jgi:hypothetical protein
MTMELKAKSGDNEITIPLWLWGSVGAVMLATVGAMGTWVGTKLQNHDDRLMVHESRLAIAETQLIANSNTNTRMEGRIEKMDEKIDRLLDLTRKAN